MSWYLVIVLSLLVRPALGQIERMDSAQRATTLKRWQTGVIYCVKTDSHYTDKGEGLKDSIEATYDSTFYERKSDTLQTIGSIRFPSGRSDHKIVMYDRFGNAIRSSGSNWTDSTTYTPDGLIITRWTNAVSMWIETRKYENKTPWKYHETTTDTKGRIVDVSIRTGAGLLASRDIFKYDAKGRLKTKLHQGHFEAYQTEKERDAERNTHSEVLKQRALNKGLRTTSWTEYRYNNQGNCVQERTYSSRDSVLKMKKQFFYNKKGQLVRQIDSSFFHLLRDWQANVHRFTYDHSGRLLTDHVEYDYYNQPRTAFWHTEYFYSSKGLLLFKTFQSESKRLEYNYQYDERGNIIAELRWENNKPWRVIRYRYSYQ